MDMDLLKAIYANGDNLLADVQEYLDKGADPSACTKYGETPLRVASNNGRFDVVKLLLEKGADETQLEWTDLFHALAFGSSSEVEELITGGADLEVRDRWSRTPFLFSILVGDRDKIKLLMDAGAKRDVVGRCGKVPVVYAIQKDDAALLKWMIDEGFDFEQIDEFKGTPLMVAAQYSALECIKVLIDAGADILKTNDIPEQAIEVAYDLQVIRVLLNAGADIINVNAKMRAEMLGYRVGEAPDISREDYVIGRERLFGSSNPDRTINPFWLAMVKGGANAYRARAMFEKKEEIYKYRQPVWCYDRFGKSLTPLADGRFIEIAGEHEDSYDPDFCIYNDVFVHSGDGQCEIYTYPRDVFPPTDFHTATLIDGQIYIIGSLGYAEDRRPEVTPVYRLDIKSMKIEKLETSGDMPGWINSHKARFDGTSNILIKGGMLCTKEEGDGSYVANVSEHSLCVKSLKWSKIQTT